MSEMLQALFQNQVFTFCFVTYVIGCMITFVFTIDDCRTDDEIAVFCTKIVLWPLLLVRGFVRAIIKIGKE